MLILMSLFLPLDAFAQEPIDYTIALESRQFLPPEDTESFLSTIQEFPPGLHVILQFFENPDPTQRALLESKGIELLDFISNDAWFAFVSSSLSTDDPVLFLIRFIGEILPTDKFPPRIQAEGIGPWAVNPDGTVNLSVQFFSDVPLTEAQQVVNSIPGVLTLLETVTIPNVSISVTVTDSTVLNLLAAHDKVQWIEEVPPPPELDNDDVRANINLSALRAAKPRLIGNGINVGVFDGGDVDSTHFDFQTVDGNPATARVTEVDNVGANSHATHVAGTLGGDGSRSAAQGGAANQWEGVARGVRIFSYQASGNQFDKHLDAIQNRNVNISNNSWSHRVRALLGVYNIAGAGTPTISGDSGPQYDSLIRGVGGRRISILRSAGNGRTQPHCTTPPPITFGCINAPSIAKNVITVGAINSDNDTMTGFSGWGPTRDGRTKPDLVGPGCQSGGDGGIKSTTPVNTYTVLCGTSMSTPAVSGAAALLKEEFINIFGRDPLPSSIKALLIDGAVDLRAQNGGLGNDGPDYTTGFGRVDIDASVTHLQNGEITEQAIGHRETHFFRFLVPPGAQKVRATLAWDDRPGNPNSCNAPNFAGRCLVNDLDLVLVDPNGTRHFPWLLNPAAPAVAATRQGCLFKGGRTIGRTTSCDDRNNVEVVDLRAALGDVIVPGPWTAEVIGFSIPRGTQAYSLSSIKVAPVVTNFTGKAHGIGLGEKTAGVGITGIFTFEGNLDLRVPTTLRITSLFNEVGGAGEVVKNIRLTLVADPRNNANVATFKTAVGVLPIAKVTIGAKGGGRFTFRVDVAKATIVPPSLCPTTNLHTTFTFVDGVNSPVLISVSTEQPWLCFGTGNKYLKSPPP